VGSSRPNPDHLFQNINTTIHTNQINTEFRHPNIWYQHTMQLDTQRHNGERRLQTKQFIRKPELHEITFGLSQVQEMITFSSHKQEFHGRAKKQNTMAFQQACHHAPSHPRSSPSFPHSIADFIPLLSHDK
jgi:hypothetical protein